MQTKENKPVERKEENWAQQLVTKYLPYWPLFLLFLALSLAGAYFYLKYTVPMYEASATIIIKDEKKGNEDSKMTESLDLMSSKKIVENEIEVLQSRKLMEMVVKALHLYAPVTVEGKIHEIPGYVMSPVSIEAKMPDSVTGVDKVYFTFDKGTKIVTLDNGQKCPINEFVKTSYGVIRFVPNKNYDGSPVERPLYFSLGLPVDYASGLVNALRVSAANKLSSIVEMVYKDEIPKRAEDILNQLIHSYDQSALDEKSTLARNTLAFVEERLGLVQHDLDSIEQKISAFKSGRNAVDMSTQGQLYLQNVSANDQKLSEINVQLSALNQVDKFAKDGTGGIVPSTLGISDPMLSGLMDKKYNLELEYERMHKTVGENNPNLLAIKDQINKIAPSIEQNIESQRQSLTAARQNISSTNGGYNAMLSGVPQKERQLLDISREQNTKSNIYAFLLQKKEESELSYASAVSNNKVIDTAKAGDLPVSPKKKIIYMMAICLALGLAVAIVTIKESFTGKVLYRHELEALTTIPVVGEVAYDKSKKAIVIESGRKSFIAEEFRKLRISLSFLGIDADHKKILVTSSIPDEGKSFIAANLAVSLSLTGKKVVLVDLDLNNPSLSKILEVHQEIGVTEFLKGEVNAEATIKPVEAHPGLSFISAGELPDDPSELLLNGKVKDIINYLESKFDVVILDTSPAVLITDAYVLSGMCDATLYVVRHKYTPKMLIKRLDESNNINPFTNPAIVFNAVKSRGFFKSNYGYGYNYVYGGKKESKEKKAV